MNVFIKVLCSFFVLLRNVQNSRDTFILQTTRILSRGKFAISKIQSWQDIPNFASLSLIFFLTERSCWDPVASEKRMFQSLTSGLAIAELIPSFAILPPTFWPRKLGGGGAGSGERRQDGKKQSPQDILRKMKL